MPKGVQHSHRLPDTPQPTQPLHTTNSIVFLTARAQQPTQESYTRASQGHTTLSTLRTHLQTALQRDGVVLPLGDDLVEQRRDLLKSLAAVRGVQRLHHLAQVDLRHRCSTPIISIMLVKGTVTTIEAVLPTVIYQRKCAKTTRNSALALDPRTQIPDSNTAC